MWKACFPLLLAAILSACGESGGSTTSSAGNGDGSPGSGEPKSEGTVTAPVTIPVGLVRESSVAGDTVGPFFGGNSFYRFTADATDIFKITIAAEEQPGTFTLTGWPALLWTLYTNPDFETGEIAKCDLFVFGAPFPEECALQLTGGEMYYLRVTAREFDGTFYELAVLHGLPTGTDANDGTVANPVILDLEAAGIVNTAAHGSAHVEFNIPRAGSWHLDSGATGDVNHAWTLYEDNNFTQAMKACNVFAGVTFERCSFSIQNPGTYYLKVDNLGDLPSEIGLHMTDQVEVLVDEGSPAAPVPLTPSTTVTPVPPRDSAVGTLGTSYYQFTATGDKNYSVNLQDTFSAILHFGIFTTPDGTDALIESIVIGGTTGLGLGELAPGTYYVRVTDLLPSIAFPERGERFRLQVVEL